MERSPLLAAVDEAAGEQPAKLKVASQEEKQLEAAAKAGGGGWNTRRAVRERHRRGARKTALQRQARAALRILEGAGGPAAEKLSARVLDFEHRGDWAAGLWALETLAGSMPLQLPAVLLIVQVLEDTTGHTAQHRCLAADAVGICGGSNAGESVELARALTKTCLADHDPSVRRHAACALERLQCTEAVDSLAKALCNDTDVAVRRHAAQALGQLKELSRPAASELINALEDPNLDVRRNAVLALEHMDNQAVKTSKQQRTADEVTTVLVGQLIKALSDPSYKVRKNAAQTLGKLGEGAAPAAAALAAVAATDAHADVRCRALDALGRVGKVRALGAEVVAVLGEVVLRESETLDTRRVAAVALSRLGVGAQPAAASLREAKLALEAELAVVAKAEAEAAAMTVAVTAAELGGEVFTPVLVPPKPNKRAQNKPKQQREILGLVSRTLAQLG